MLVADEICSETLRPAKGILAGRPFATVMAKIYLWDLTRDALLNQRPFQITTWVDDVGMDTANRSCRAAAVHMVSCYSAFVAGLVPSGLDMAVEKSGFVVSSKELRRELRLLLRKLPGPVPKVYDVLKDLGLDCTLVRKRRLPTQKQRVAKAGKRLWKLSIFYRGVRQRLYRTNAFPAQIWGQQHQGTAPRTVHLGDLGMFMRRCVFTGNVIRIPCFSLRGSSWSFGSSLLNMLTLGPGGCSAKSRRRPWKHCEGQSIDGKL